MKTCIAIFTSLVLFLFFLGHKEGVPFYFSIELLHLIEEFSFFLDYLCFVVKNIVKCLLHWANERTVEVFNAEVLFYYCFLHSHLHHPFALKPVSSF